MHPMCLTRCKYSFLMQCLSFTTVVLLAATVAAVSTPTAKQQEKSQLLSSIRSDVQYIKESVWNFWAIHGPDNEYGSFHATLTRSGSPAQPTDKGLVQSTRHVWAFSEYQRHGITSLAGKAPFTAKVPQQSSVKFPPTSQQMAKSAYTFLASHMWDSNDRMFYWMVSRDGRRVLHANKSLYAQWFVMYSLSNYYTAFGDEEAKQLALECFYSVDARWHNHTTGGYNELFSNSIGYAFTPNAAALKDYTMARTVNSMMHQVEALEALHRVTNDQTVLQRMLETLDIMCSKLVRLRGHLLDVYEPQSTTGGQWQPAAGAIVSYGHNLEACWLLGKTVQYLRSINAIPQQTAAAYTAALMSVGDASLSYGYDSQHGGVFELGTLTAPTSLVKVWWVQAEAVQAMWVLYEYHGRDVGYLQKLQASMRFLKTYVTDGVYGEQFWQVAADGNFNIEYQPGPDRKGTEWKASYHSSRAVLNLGDWLAQE